MRCLYIIIRVPVRETTTPPHHTPPQEKKTASACGASAGVVRRLTKGGERASSSAPPPIGRTADRWAVPGANGRVLWAAPVLGATTPSTPPPWPSHATCAVVVL
ncbi:unnamed protein product [Macrosiphum euphorbiae]|uniref:Uncharacterized protein n=1 Tax=Macrosiphum euphorbiae TaxID=13131 RepID=A0AAV0VW55_9HEMI|nr:unnamed protein product [Macrosiphum euphorbiae]